MAALASGFNRHPFWILYFLDIFKVHLSLLLHWQNAGQFTCIFNGFLYLLLQVVHLGHLAVYLVNVSVILKEIFMFFYLFFLINFFHFDWPLGHIEVKLSVRGWFWCLIFWFFLQIYGFKLFSSVASGCWLDCWDVPPLRLLNEQAQLLSIIINRLENIWVLWAEDLLIFGNSTTPMGAVSTIFHDWISNFNKFRAILGFEKIFTWSFCPKYVVFFDKDLWVLIKILLHLYSHVNEFWNSIIYFINCQFGLTDLLCYFHFLVKRWLHKSAIIKTALIRLLKRFINVSQFFLFGGQFGDL